MRRRILSAEPATDAFVGIDPRRVPRHIAIIMDGNGRWAHRRGLPRTAGHRAGVEALRRVVEACGDLGVEYLTLYTFSTENWRRPRAEVAALMDLLVESLQRYLDDLHHKGVRGRAIGDLAGLPAAPRAAIEEAVARTAGNSRMTVIFALNYGGRREIVEAARAIAREAAAGTLRPDDLDDSIFASYLYTDGIPDPDLLIRPSGEQRLSNFLLWQTAYTELWVTPVLWPDFGREDLYQAVRDYQMRERRFGGAPGEHRC